MSGHKCVVPGCSNKREGSNIKQFSFPADLERCLIWCRNLGISPSTPDPIKEFKHKRVCEMHFDETQVKVTRSCTLIAGAVPCNRIRSSPLTDISNLSNTRTPNAQSNSESFTENVTPRGISNTPRRAEGMTSPDNKAEIKKLKLELLAVKTKLRKLEETRLTPLLVKEYFKDGKTLKYIMEMQVLRYGKGARKHYSDMEKTMSLTLYYCCGRKGYDTLKHLGFKLPATATIRRWICKLNFKPGRNQDILDCLKEKVALMNDYERNCVLALDETSLQRMLTYNKPVDEIEGFEDYGNNERTSRVADQVLVLMVAGISTSWNTALSFHFSRGCTTADKLKQIVLGCIDDLMEIGLRVRAVVSDQGGTNQGLFKRLEVTKDKPYINHNGHEIDFMFDIPHSIKNIRNGIMNGGLRIEGEPYEILWDHYKQLYERDSASTLRTCPKLKDSHFHLTNFSKMSVKLAVQVVASKSVADGFKERIARGELPQSFRGTAEFTARLDRIFDMMNGSKLYCASKPWKSAQNVFNILNEFLTEMEWVGKIKKASGTGNSTLPCINGLQLSLHSMHRLLGHLQAEGFTFVQTRKFQSDRVEHFFSFMKYHLGAADKPTCKTFRLTFRYMFIKNLIKGSEGSNCEQFEESESVRETMRKIRFLLKKNTRKSQITESSNLENVDDDDDDSDEFESDGEDSNDEDRLNCEMNNFFKGLTDLESNDSAKNAAIYMAAWAIKSVTRKRNCNNCKSKLLEFVSERPSQALDNSEQLTFLKAYDKTIFDKNLDLSYGHVLSIKSKLMAKEFAEVVAPDIFKSFNLYSTHVTRNIFRSLSRNMSIGLWLHDDESEVCRKHRKEIINLMIRARLYRLLEDMNGDIKTSSKRPTKRAKTTAKHDTVDETGDNSDTSDDDYDVEPEFADLMLGFEGFENRDQNDSFDVE